MRTHSRLIGETKSIKLGVALFALLAITGNSAAKTVIFDEDFESDLSAWTGKNAGSSQGVITPDPITPGNSVLSFLGLNLSGDIFTSSSVALERYNQILISFDYLGQARTGSIIGNLGGFFGFSLNLNPVGGDAAWLAGTDQSAANGLGFSGVKLIDDGDWHRYQLDITSVLQDNHISQIHIMLEDWKDAGGVPGDTFFDNILIEGVAVPEGGSTAAMLLMSLMLYFTVPSRRFSLHW